MIASVLCSEAQCFSICFHPIANYSASINVFVLFVFATTLRFINQNTLGEEAKNSLK